MKPALSTETSRSTPSTPSERELRFILVVAIAAVVVLLPIIIFGIPNGADLPNHLRFAQPFYESIQSGHWHPAWLAESNDGFGDPRFSFYPPGLYYLLAAGRMLTGNWYAASIAVCALLSIVGGLGTYFWARAFCSPKIAMWAGVLYTIAPYHLNELYQASLLSEYAACAILPFAFAFTERICRDRKVGDVAGLGAAYALLVLTHLPLTVIGAISLAIYAVLRIERKNLLSTTIRLASGVAVGLAASAFFWTTMLAELAWIKGSSAQPNVYYDYRVNFLFSPAALANRNTWYANILALALIGFLLPGIALAYRFLKDRAAGRGLKAALVLSVTTFLMATALSRPVWAIIPRLSEIQFPWRWLAIPSLAGCLLVAASIPNWKKRFRASLRPRDLAIALAFALSLVFVATQIIQDCDYLDRGRFDSMASEARGAPSFPMWLPVAAHDLLHLDLKKPKVFAGSRSVTLQSWEPEHRQFQIAAGEQTEARVRTFYYPDWVATAGGRRLATRPSEDGAILIAVPPNASDVTLEFQPQPRVHKAELFSAISWILIGALLLAQPANAFLRERSSGRARKLLLLPKLMTSNSIKRFAPPAFALLAGALALLPVVIWGVPNNNDLANHYHFALPFYEAIQRGDFHPGWLASPNFGYGDAVVRFYPPALYYLLAAGRTLTGNWYSASLLVLTSLSALGSFAAYFWARSYVPRRIAIWAAVFYSFMPYHLAEVYQASLLAEFAAGAALLFALAFTKRLCDQGRGRDLVGLAASYALLILSHLPLAVFGSLTLLIYALMNIPRTSREIILPLPNGRGEKARTIVKLSLAVLLGLAASAFYWTTMAVELKWIVADGANPDPLLDYRRNFVFSSFSPEKNETIWWMGLLAIATVMMLLPAVIVFAKKFSAPSNRALLSVAVLVTFSLLMTTQISKPVWAAIPFLRLAQHPFRWLAVTSAVAPILMAASVPFWAERLRHPRRAVALAMAGLVLIAASFSISQTVRGATYLSRPTFEQMLRPLNEAPGIIQWLPVWASATGQGKASYEKCIPPPVIPARIDAGDRAIRISEWNDLSRTFEVESGSTLEARVSTFYYPHWTATANGQALVTHPAADGALLISLPPERVTVNLQFREPPRAKLSAVVSIISWTLLASLLIFGSFVSQRRRAKAN